MGEMEIPITLGTFDNLLILAYVTFIIWFVVSIIILAQFLVPLLTGVAAFLFSLTILLLFFALVEGFRGWLRHHNIPAERPG